MLRSGTGTRNEPGLLRHCAYRIATTTTQANRIRVRYTTYEFGPHDIHVKTLRNNLEYDDRDGQAARLGITSATWSLFGIVWTSGEMLARLMWERNFHGERILELGCGIGLASLALAVRGQDITATDKHPEAKAFLQYNAKLNHLPPIHYERCSWEQTTSSLGKFDLIIGSDLLYDHGSIDALTTFIDQHSRDNCEVFIVDPNRGLRGKFSNSIAMKGFTARARTDVNILPGSGVNASVLAYNKNCSP